MYGAFQMGLGVETHRFVIRTGLAMNWIDLVDAPVLWILEVGWKSRSIMLSGTLSHPITGGNGPMVLLKAGFRF